jgi:hypothetical protein
MADRRGLEVVGVVFGLVTAIVIMVGGIVVKNNLDGHLTRDTRAGNDAVPPVVSVLDTFAR